jgi:hypothetical protein
MSPGIELYARNSPEYDQIRPVIGAGIRSWMRLLELNSFRRLSKKEPTDDGVGRFMPRAAYELKVRWIDLRSNSSHTAQQRSESVAQPIAGT